MAKPVLGAMASLGGGAGSSGRAGSGSGVGGISSTQRLRTMCMNLAGYSNQHIVEIAKGFVETSKESVAMASECQKTYVESLQNALAAEDPRRCLALLYVCNEMLTVGRADQSWQAVLSKAIKRFLPLICVLALNLQVFAAVSLRLSPFTSCECLCA